MNEKICCLIGDPIEHSLSPLMHNMAFDKLKLDYVYFPIRVKKEMIQKAIVNLRKPNVRGINVTIPHKVIVMDLLDEIDDLAKEIGAVNTIVKNNGELVGYNTDGTGALRALKEGEGYPKGKKIVVIGAGGASRSVSYSIARENPSELVIINRTEQKAIELAENIKKKLNANVKPVELKLENLETELKNTDVVINTTSIGMNPNVDENIIPKELLNENMLVMDIVYNPLETKFLREAKEVGAKIINGIEMFIYQGAETFEMWTGEKAPVELMRKVVLEELKGENK